MAVTEQTVPIGVYDVTCDATWCTARYGAAAALTEIVARRRAAMDGWRCDMSGDWCPEHASAESASAPFHADTNAQIDQRRSYLDEMTAAYLADLARALKDVVLVEERDGMTTRWWFERKGDR